MTDQRLIWVIIINWNGREHLEACLDSVLESVGVHFHCLVVDNGSTDDSVPWMAARYGGESRIEVLALAENLGWSGGNNAGLRLGLAAGAGYFFLLNNDTAIAPDALARLAERMAAEPDLGALAPRMVLFDQPGILNSVGIEMATTGAAWDRGVGRMDGPDWHGDGPVLGVCGGAWFLRASPLREVGLLPEDFGIYLDDLDLCIRLWRAGYRVCACPAATVRHKFSATMGQGKRARHKYYLNTRNRFRILLRHAPVRAWGAVLGAVLIGEVKALGRALLSGEVWRIPLHVRAWGAALGYFPEAWRFRQHAGGARDFWALVRTHPRFCPEVVLPVEGWYPPVERDGLRWRPMAWEAVLTASAGALQVSVATCYSGEAPTRVSVYCDGGWLGEVVAGESNPLDLNFGGGVLRFVAAQCYPREQTGLPHDTGALLRVLIGDRPLH